MDKKCYGCIYYDPCWMKCRLGREPKDCSFYAMLKLKLSSVYGTQVRK